MKGIIFSLLENLVEEKFGLEAWDRILNQLSLSSGGAYTAADTYPDAELFDLVATLSQQQKISVDDLIKEFGRYSLLKLSESYSVFFEDHDFKSFLLSIHDVVHVEVKKLYPDANLPDFFYQDSDEGLVMIYQSDRKLCALAEGLIKGASEYFKTPYVLNHPKCMHHGDEHCRLEIQIQEQ